VQRSDARSGIDQAGHIFSQKYRISERRESEIIAADPMTGDIKSKVHTIYPNVSGVLTTAGGLVFTGLPTDR